MTPENLPPVDLNYKAMKIKYRQRWPKVVALIMALAGVIIAGGAFYIMQLLSPVDTASNQQHRFIITEGQSAATIGRALEDAKLIRSAAVFQLYTKLTGNNSRLQAGGYILKQSQSVSQIVEHISSGKTDEVNVTLLPGLTLKELADPNVKGSLAQQGFSSQEIVEAFRTNVDSPVLAGKNGSSLEGYLYPETYKIMANNSLDTVVQMSVNELNTQIKKRGLQDKLKQQGLSLRDGIILASIVQKEVNHFDDQRQVAQVFLKRLKENTVLGSDVTFIYAAKLEDRTPDVDDDSPYNTRKHAGLPPGPIANFAIQALEAVANPASGDYLYFVAGDDGKTYFAKTEAEHLDNVAKYCKTLCQ